MDVDEPGRDDQALRLDDLRRAVVSGSILPIAAIRSPRMATSPSNQGFPVPSTIRPPRMTRSQGSGSAGGLARRPRRCRERQNHDAASEGHNDRLMPATESTRILTLPPVASKLIEESQPDSRAPPITHRALEPS